MKKGIFFNKRRKKQSKPLTYAIAPTNPPPPPPPPHPPAPPPPLPHIQFCLWGGRGRGGGGGCSKGANYYRQY